MLSLPNILTLARIAAVPVVVVLILLDDHLWRWLALAVYAVACVTDYLDGYLARVLDTQSDFGRLLDPIADKILVGACLLVLTAVDGESYEDTAEICGCAIGTVKSRLARARQHLKYELALEDVIFH